MKKKLRPLTESEKKWGRVCDGCGIRETRYFTGSSAEGGKTSKCICPKE